MEDNDEAERKRLLEEREAILRQLAEISDIESDGDEATLVNVDEPNLSRGPHTPSDPPPETSTDADDVDNSPDTPGKARFEESFCVFDSLSDKNDSEFGFDQISNDEYQIVKTPDGTRCQSMLGFVDELDENGGSNEGVGLSSKTSKCPFSGDTSFIDRELEEMIEGPVDEMVQEKKEEIPSNMVWKTVLERVDHDIFNPLPDGWVSLTHNSGMQIYLHKETRVISLSKPYKCTENVIRNHQIPASSVPCLYRRRMNEKILKKQEELDKKAEEATNQCAGSSILSQVGAQILAGANAGIEKANEEEKLSPEEFRTYCASIFKFKEILVKRFANCSEKMEARKDQRINKILKKAGVQESYEELKKRADNNDPLLRTGTSPFIDITPLWHKRNVQRKSYLLNPYNRTTVTVLNEFMQRLIRGRVEYVCEDNRNVSCPYKATAWLTIRTAEIVNIAGNAREKLALLKEQSELAKSTIVDGDSQKFPIGRGIGNSKKTARLASAKEALLKMIPSLGVRDDYICEGVRDKSSAANGAGGDVKGFDEEAMELLDRVKIDAKNLVAVCIQFGMTKPYNLLKDAVNRSIRFNGMNLTTDKLFIGNGTQMSRVRLKLGDLQQEAEANGVKNATQLAAQLLLKEIHPEFESYGSFLRLYGGFEDRAYKENAKKHHDEVVRLQNKGHRLQPNHAVLGKLREEMSKVALIHPPRKFLYGLAKHNSGDSASLADRHDAGTQTVDVAMMGYPPLPPPPPPPPPPSAAAAAAHWKMYGAGAPISGANSRKRMLVTYEDDYNGVRAGPAPALPPT